MSQGFSVVFGLWRFKSVADNHSALRFVARANALGRYVQLLTCYMFVVPFLQRVYKYFVLESKCKPLKDTEEAPANIVLSGCKSAPTAIPLAYLECFMSCYATLRFAWCVRQRHSEEQGLKL